MRRALIAILTSVLLISSCQSAPAPGQTGKKTIVVTYSILGAVVKELVGEAASVVVLVPNGQDPHEWEPSARDIETLNKADLVIQNGLDLESGLQKTLVLASQGGVKTFTASDYIAVRRLGQAEGAPGGTEGVPDPHLWTDPKAIQQVVAALSERLQSDLGLDVSGRAGELSARLDELNAEITSLVETLPQADRKLVTGHDSLGYFAARYGFEMLGAIIPSLTSQAEVSAADLAALKGLITDHQVKVIFTELGTPPAIARAIGQETGVQVIEISTHLLPADGSYFSYMRDLAQTIVDHSR